MSNEYYAGVSKKIITPEKPIIMAGYVSRTGKSSCKLDDLYVKTLFLEDINNNDLLLVSIDLIRIDNELYNEIVTSISKRTNLRTEQIHVAATHTHSGPEISTSFWNTLPLTEEDLFEVKEYRKKIVSETLEAALEAINDLTRVHLFVGKTRIKDVASNRVKPGGPVDPEAVYMLGKTNSKLKFLLINYACHPTVLGPENTCISGDLAGRTARILEEKLGTITLYFNGAAGNISTRYTRKAQNMECLEMLASRIAYPLYESIITNKYEEISSSSIVSGAHRLVLKAKRVEEDIQKIKGLMIILEEQLRQLKTQNTFDKGMRMPEIRNIKSKYEGLKVLLNRINYMKKINRIEATIGYAYIGNSVVMIFFPGEAYVELQLMAKKKSRYPYVFFIGYADGYIGYVPIDEWNVENSLVTYEKIVSIIDPVEIEKINELIEKIIS